MICYFLKCNCFIFSNFNFAMKYQMLASNINTKVEKITFKWARKKIYANICSFVFAFEAQSVLWDEFFSNGFLLMKMHKTACTARDKKKK